MRAQMGTLAVQYENVWYNFHSILILMWAQLVRLP
jgi:hypothetical protein